MQNSLSKHRIGCLTFDGRAKRLLWFVRPDEFVQQLSKQQQAWLHHLCSVMICLVGLAHCICHDNCYCLRCVKRLHGHVYRLIRQYEVTITTKLL